MRVAVAVGLVMAVLGTGCGLQDVNTPVPQPDTTIFGRIAGITPVAGEEGAVDVAIQAGLPESMSSALQRDGRPVPQLEKDLKVSLKVTAETLCLADYLPTDIDSFRVGQEVAVVPVPGSSAMVGSKKLLATAAELSVFSAFQVRYLAGSLEKLPPEVAEPSDPARINSAGAELSPLPLYGGKVLYFAAGLTPSARPDLHPAPMGAVRAGMGTPESLQTWAVGGFRPYRVEWSKDGWGKPEPVQLSGIPEDANVRMTWVRKDETACLIEVLLLSGERQLWAARRDDARKPWGALEQLTLPSGRSVGDAQRFGPELTYMIWTAYEPETSDLWLQSPDKPSQILEPRINTMGPEYSPRLGPKSILYFCRGDRQLLFENQMVREVRLPGKQRRPLLEAAPVADGSWVFCRIPRYTPGQLDWNIAVVPRQGDGWGAPVLVDDWKP
ncbi:MAG: hypothetical protein MUF10_12730 [Thermoanaerobaculaceae bacterium]|nr:hypothetical protein [Thermoanaerobaculaceae bacterium]